MRLFLSVLLAAIPSTCLSAQAKKPNVLFIAIDDLNDFVGCLGGHPQAMTPNIDALAARGTLFTNAHCQAPICGPSRASLLSGMLPSTTGIYLQIGDQALSTASVAASEAVFLPDYLEKHGYRTAGCGKIFHGGDRAEYFDEFGHGTNFGPKPAQRFKYNPAWFKGRGGGTQTDWGTFPDVDSKMPDHKTADWIVDWIARAASGDQDGPFFLAAGFVRPHVPWYVPKPWFDKHPLGEIKLPPYRADDLVDVPKISLEVNAAPSMPAMDWVLEENRWPEIVQSYLASTTFVDHQVGRVLDALAASRFADNTIIILWSDHGYHLGEKGRFAKQSLWERSSHVPLIIAGPNLPAAQACGQPVQLLDLYPTLLDLLGLPANKRNEGHSLMPLLKNPKQSWAHAAITSYGPNNHAIQTDRYRYIRFEDGSEELYDHRADPHEWDNLAGDPRQKPVIAKLREYLPEVNAPNARGSRYNFNPYFQRILSRR